jgi:5'-nucleotidase
LKKLRVLCDMDSVIAELNPKWYAAANADHGSNVCVADVTDWDTSKFFPCGKGIFEYLGRPGFFRDLPVMPGAYDALKAIHDAGHEVILLTACSWAEAKKDKTLWVEEHFPFLSGQLIMVDRRVPKDAIRGDVLIDDGPHNIIGYKQAYPNAFTIMFEYPYNGHARAYASVIPGSYTDMAATWARTKQIVLHLGNGGTVDYFGNEGTT